MSCYNGEVKEEEGPHGLLMMTRHHGCDYDYCRKATICLTPEERALPDYALKHLIGLRWDSTKLW
jgi:hypothetical protein